MSYRRLCGRNRNICTDGFSIVSHSVSKYDHNNELLTSELGRQAVELHTYPQSRLLEQGGNWETSTAVAPSLANQQSPTI